MAHLVFAQDIADHVNAHPPVQRVDALVQTLTKGSFRLVDGSGKVLRVRRRGSKTVRRLSIEDMTQALRRSRLTSDQAGKLWEFFADEDNASLLTLQIVESLIAAGNTPEARAALWSEMAYLTRVLKRKRTRRARSLLGLFERHRARLRPLIAMGRDTEIGGDEMIDVMLSSRVFGSSFKESLAWLSEHNPAAIARRIEFDRGRGRPVSWERSALKEILKWKNAHYQSKAAQAPRSLAELDAVGETFIIIFNNFHDLNPIYRESMLRGLEPTDAFNAVIGGEFELYRMGTSGYREYLHPMILQGIKQQGSFEAFVDKATRDRLGDGMADAAGQRSMVFLRVVSTFGLLEEVLETVRDRRRFIDDAIASVGDPHTFRRNGSVLVELLTTPSKSPAVAEFREILNNKLYARYSSEHGPMLRSIYGSMLSVYQTITGDRREAAIDRAFPLDSAMLHIPFNRLFSTDSKRGLVHRMFMRMDEDVDAINTYAGFHAMMRARGASIRRRRHYVLYRFTSGERAIEIYVNKPTSPGVKHGITEIAAALRGKTVQSAIGRGHTYIIGPFLKDSGLIMGDGVRDVAMVLIGSCGGEASMRDIIDTFGYTSVLTTRSIGRQLINNAIIAAYIDALFSLRTGDQLFLNDVLKRAVRKFSRRGVSSDLRDDATNYRLSLAAVLTAFLFDSHVRRYAQSTIR